jgi:hypothetical protein
MPGVSNAFTCMGDWHGASVVPVTRAEWEKARRRPQLAELCRQIEAGNEALKRRLPVWTPHCAEFKGNHRSIADALKPLPRLMLDFDEKGHSAEILEKALQLQQQGKWKILLVEDSVRRGTHVLIQLPAGMTAEEAQQRFSHDVGFMADAAVKDVSRCIYLVTEAHTLYVSDELFAGTSCHLRERSEESENIAPPSRSGCTQILRDAQDDKRGDAPLDDKKEDASLDDKKGENPQNDKRGDASQNDKKENKNNLCQSVQSVVKEGNSVVKE